MADLRQTSGVPLLLVLLALFAAGGAWLLSRTVARDIQHPTYSTLNDTPQGARVLFDALSHLPLDVQRRYDANAPLPDNATLFRIGPRLSWWSLDDIPMNLEEATFVADGGRLVYTFSGARPNRASAAAAITNQSFGTTISFTKGLSLVALSNLTAQAEADAAQIPWHSALAFELSPEASNRWHTLYAVEGYPVMVETRHGKGSVILATDCYFLSNEGLAQDSRPELLSALVGPARIVLFDETIHGISEKRNLTWLMHRYRLHGLIIALALPVLLALWQHASPLLPRARETTSTHQQGLRTEDGLVSLLRGHMPAARLPRQLYEAWRQTAPPSAAASDSEMEDLLETAEANRTPPAETCRALYQLVQQKKHTRTRRDP